MQERPDDAGLIIDYLGQVFAQMHSAGIIHGDLTTSNVIVRPSRDAGSPGFTNGDSPSFHRIPPNSCGNPTQLTIIDFGLSNSSAKGIKLAEDLDLFH